MAHHTYQKNWFQRHWKWILPLSVVVLLIPVFTTPFGSALKEYGTLYSDPSIYEDALVELRKNKEAIDLLGEPVETLFLIEGEVQYSDDGNSVKMSIPIKGSKAKGRMDVQANRLNGEWN